MTDERFFRRRQGEGPYWQIIQRLFEAGIKQAGFPEKPEAEIPKTFSRPSLGQQALFQEKLNET